MFDQLPNSRDAALVRSAKILEFDEQRQLWCVALDGSDQKGYARSAIASALAFPQEVVVVGSPKGELFIIGLLEPRAERGRRVRSRSGAEARLSEGPDGERLQITSPAGELVLEFEPETGKVRLLAPSGDVELAAPAGGIELTARDAVSLHGSQQVEITSDQSVALRSGELGHTGTGSVTVDRGKVDLSGQVIGMASELANVQVEQLNLVGERLRAKLDDARAVVETLDVAVDVAKSKARRVYHKVEELLQTRAGRMRSVVEGSVHLKGRLLMFKSDEDTKLKGKHIHLG